MPHRICLIVTRALVALTLALGGLLPSVVRADERTFLVISDLHFNPFHGLSADQFQQLAQLPSDQWPSFFDKLDQPVVQLGTDSNYALVKSAVDGAAKVAKDPSFILYPGDLMGHDWQCTYNELASRKIEDDPQAFRDFTANALQLIASQLKLRFPNTPVLPTLGNDDAFCQDYWVQPGGQFLLRYSQVWGPLLGSTVKREEFSDSFSKLGCYVADLPDLADHRLIVLNTILWSNSYCSSYHAPDNVNCCSCTNPGSAPGREQFSWFARQLEKAKTEKKRVWLLMHVPPGLDSYKENKTGGASAAAELWTTEFLTRYLQLVREHQEVLQLSFAGHTHMDDYRVDSAGNRPVLLHKVAPAVSPVYGNNPAFQTYQCDSRSGIVTNWQTYYLPIAGATDTNAATWQLEYDAKATYGLDSLNAPNVARLFAEVLQQPNGDASENYRKFYSVSANTILTDHVAIYACAILNPTYPQFHRCVSEANVEPPKQLMNPSRLRRLAGGIGEPKR